MNLLGTTGQERRNWLEGQGDKVYNLLRYYLGPTGIPDRLVAAGDVANMFNPVNDITGSMAAAGRGDWGDAALQGAIAVAPAVPAAYAMKVGAQPMASAAAGIEDVLTGFAYSPGLNAAGDAGQRFIASEAGSVGVDPVAARGDEILSLVKTDPQRVTDEMLDLGDPVLNTRLNEYLFRNYDLPMDEASRMARAGEMGLDGDWYHGTNQPVTAVDTSRAGAHTKAINTEGTTWATNSPLEASDYAQASAERQIANAVDVEAQSASLLSQMDKAEARGDWDAYDALTRQLEDLEIGAIRAEPEGQNVIPMALPRGANVNADGFVPVGRSLEMLNEARSSGAPSLTFQNIVDGPVLRDPTNHIAVFDPANIRSRFARFDPRLSHLRNLNAGLAGGAALLGLLDKYGLGDLAPQEQPES